MNFKISQLALWWKGVRFLVSVGIFGFLIFFLSPVLVATLLWFTPELWRVEIEIALLARSWRAWELRRVLEKAGVFIKLTSFKPKHVDFRWIKPTEWSRVMLRLVRLLGLPVGPSMVLSERLLKVWIKSGTPFFITYLKECRLALIAWANRSQYVPNHGCRVRIAPCGFPAVVPFGLRPQTLSTVFGRLQFRGLHTVFSLYRVIDWKGSLPDFSSITNPFVGVSEVLPLAELKTVLTLFKVPKWSDFSGYCSPWESTSSGPNHPWSTWSSAKDSLAWATSPIMLIWYAVWCFESGQILLAVWLVVLSHILLPVAILMLFRGVVYRLGRLAVLAKDGGGKRRIVGVVDFWSQWALKPLHLYLFAILKMIPQDGTFDQMSPIQGLLHYSRLGIPSYSFDLSNATDRLPAAVQQQILTILISRLGAKAWRCLLTYRQYFHPRVGSIKYAVGQPIGALSSWAILALTHHVIVQLAAYRSGWRGWFPLYALLGDDIVILREDVSREYLSLMRYLGVPINMSKTISSQNGLIEFAKRVVSSHYGDLSPLSGRLLVTAVRNPAGWPDVWTHMLDFGFILFPNQLLRIISSLSSDLLRKPFTASKDPLIGKGILARVFILSRIREGVVLRPRLVDEWYRAILGRADLGPLLERAAKSREIWMVSQGAKSEHRRAFVQLYVYATQWWRYSLFKGTLGGIISIPLLMLSPAFWVALVTRLQAVLKLSQASLWFVRPSTQLVRIDPIDVDTSGVHVPSLEIRKPELANVITAVNFWTAVVSDCFLLEDSQRRGRPKMYRRTTIGVSGLLAAPTRPL